VARTALLIDADAASAKLERIVLQAEGWLVVHVATGDEALALLRRVEPDLIVIDILLPPAASYARIHRMKDLAPHVPIIAVTVLDGPEAELGAMSAGCSGFISKPIDVSTFATQLSRFLGVA
jgi:CheY-like chemotaxis protein